jgi:hypothetical protein
LPARRGSSVGIRDASDAIRDAQPSVNLKRLCLWQADREQPGRLRARTEADPLG